MGKGGGKVTSEKRAYVVDGSRYNGDLDIFKKLDKPLKISVPMELEYEYEKKILDFFMKYGRKEYASVAELYERVFPKAEEDDSRRISISVSEMEERRVLLRSIPGAGVEYPKGSGLMRLGYMINPKIKAE